MFDPVLHTDPLSEAEKEFLHVSVENGLSFVKIAVRLIEEARARAVPNVMLEEAP